MDINLIIIINNKAFHQNCCKIIIIKKNINNLIAIVFFFIYEVNLMLYTTIQLLSQFIIFCQKTASNLIMKWELGLSFP